jgi:oligopeptide/dipeptide ABC transporter ATP-binding protein
LISAVPVPDPTVERQRQWKVPEGDVPSPVDPPQGCAFHTRCPHATDACLERPELVEIRPGGRVACHYADRWIDTATA